MILEPNFSLKKYNTFGVEVYAKYFVEFSSVESLCEILHNTKGKEKMILGGGSNVLFTKNFDGVILKNSIPSIQLIEEDEQHAYLKVGAGVNWHRFVMHCIDNSLGGVENLALIPGNVGASPMQNIGAYGVEIKDVFHELEALNLSDNTLHKFSNADCEFGYRHSVFKNKYKNLFAILNVTFRLNKTPSFNISYGAVQEELNKMKVNQLTIKAIADAVMQIRKSKLPDPEVIGNAGSFFKNPEIAVNQLKDLATTWSTIPSYKVNDKTFKVPAGWLIESCGWKGFRRGDAGCYEKQALVLVNYGKANGNDIYNLSEEIKDSVMQKFGIALQREVNIM